MASPNVSLPSPNLLRMFINLLYDDDLDELGNSDAAAAAAFLP
jgi:hypothetical protein